MLCKKQFSCEDLTFRFSPDKNLSKRTFVHCLACVQRVDGISKETRSIPGPSSQFVHLYVCLGQAAAARTDCMIGGSEGDHYKLVPQSADQKAIISFHETLFTLVRYMSRYVGVGMYVLAEIAGQIPSVVCMY